MYIFVHFYIPFFVHSYFIINRLDIKEEEYVIRYNDNANPIMINAYLLKMIEDTDKIIKVRKDNEFYIENITEMEKRIAFDKAIMMYQQYK